MEHYVKRRRRSHFDRAALRVVVLLLGDSSLARAHGARTHMWWPMSAPPPPSPPPPLNTSALCGVSDLNAASRPRTDLLELLPAPASATVARHGGRCAHRYAHLEAAWNACVSMRVCAGVVRDNGLKCSSSQPKLHYELRGGVPTPLFGADAWVCPSRLTPARTIVRGTPSLAEGFSFAMLGGCAQPEYGCEKIFELRTALSSARAAGGWAVAVLTDGGVPGHFLSSVVGADIVVPISTEKYLTQYTKRIDSRFEMNGALQEDLRAKKLIAYAQSPFERTVFLDSDTYVMNTEVRRLFTTLGRFDLAAAFECCRKVWGGVHHGADVRDPMLGWEMQAGVVAYMKIAAHPRPPSPPPQSPSHAPPHAHLALLNPALINHEPTPH